MAVARLISDQTIMFKTGKSSAQWYQIIDGFGTTNHTQIAKLLCLRYQLNPWYAQIVTNRYEWAKGLRHK